MDYYKKESVELISFIYKEVLTKPCDNKRYNCPLSFRLRL